MSDDEFNPETDYLLLSEEGWKIMDEFEAGLYAGKDVYTISAEMGFPVEDMLALFQIAEMNRLDLEVGIRADADQ